MDESHTPTSTLEEIERFHLTNALAHPTAPRIEHPTVHYSKLGKIDPKSRHYQEWNFYRREVGRLLAEGFEGKWLLIKGEEILECCDSPEEAQRTAQSHPESEAILVKQVLTFEPLYSVGYNRVLCRD